MLGKLQSWCQLQVNASDVLLTCILIIKGSMMYVESIEYMKEIGCSMKKVGFYGPFAAEFMQQIFGNLFIYIHRNSVK